MDVVIRRQRKRGLPIWPVASAALAGAALEYLLDPNLGRRRRHMARDRARGTVRRMFRGMGRRLRWTGAWMNGRTHRLAHLRPADTGTPDDVTLVHKVESMLFRDPHVPKGRINLNAENGVIVMRGALDRPEQIEALEARARKVAGVRDVVNLLHLQNTPAPHDDGRHPGALRERSAGRTDR